MKVSEIRASLFEVDDEGKHVKHVTVTATDPEACSAIVAALGARRLNKLKDGEHLDIKSPEEKAHEKQEAKDAATSEEEAA